MKSMLQYYIISDNSMVTIATLAQSTLFFLYYLSQIESKTGGEKKSNQEAAFRRKL